MADASRWDDEDSTPAPMVAAAPQDDAGEALAEHEAMHGEAYADATGGPVEPRSIVFTVQGYEYGVPSDLWGDGPSLPVPDAADLPVAIAPYILDEAETMGCDPGMLALYVLTVCAGCVTDEIRLQVLQGTDRWRPSARLWTMIVGDSGLTAKSPAIDAALSHAWKIERELRLAGAEALKAGDLERQVHEAQKADYVRKRAKGEPCDVPQEPPAVTSERLLIGSATMEGIASVLDLQGPRGALLQADELLGFVTGLNQYKAGGKGSDRQDALALYGGGPRAIDRANGRARLIRNWGVSIMGGVQSDAIAKAAAHGQLENDGLLQRFLLYLPHVASQGIDRETDKGARSRYHECLDRLYKLTVAPDLGSVRFAADAVAVAEAVREWCHETKQAGWMPAGLRSHVAKWPEIYMRLCLTYAAIEAADEHRPCIARPVSAEIAEQVARLMCGCLYAHAKHFYMATLNGSGEQHAMRQIAGLILAEGMRTITTRTMTQRSSAYRAAAEDKGARARAIVNALCELEWLRPTGGRGLVSGLPTKYEVNEAVHVRYSERAVRERAERSDAVRRWDEKRAKKAAP